MSALNRDQILELIPHGGTMSLLDRVVDWDHDSIHCCSDSHRLGEGHPLQRNHRIAGVHLVEYAAQAVAVHGGLLASGSAEQQGGFLAGLRDVSLPDTGIATIADSLDVHAYREMGGPQGMIYRFTINAGNALLSSGRLTIMSMT